MTAAEGTPPLPQSLIKALHRSREWGFLGDGPVEVHIAHALGFAQALRWAVGQGSLPGGSPNPSRLPPDPWMDLGSGGGIPGLVLAHAWPERMAVFLDSNERRTQFLSQVVAEQGWTERVEIVDSRAETAGRSERFRGQFSLVVARSFGSPPVTAECAAPFLGQGGFLIVSEPPGGAESGDIYGPARWPEDGLGLVGLTDLGLWKGTFGYRILRQSRECPDRFPRRVGVAAKRPLYRIPSS